MINGKSNVNIKLWISAASIFLTLFMTGCWDRTEVNDLALITASAYDLAPGGGIQYTVQIMLPAGGASGSAQGGSGNQQKKSFIVETAAGIDAGDAEKNIQKRFPRRLFRGHRRVIIIGEELAMHGLEGILDTISRDPKNRLRTNVLVAKGRKGSDLLKLEYPMERVPAEAIREMMSIGIGIEADIHDFLIETSSEGIQPIAVTIEPEDGKEGFKLTGIAIFKDLRLAGFLNAEESEGYLWVMGKFKKGVVATKVQGDEGVIRINVKNAEAKVTPQTQGNKVNIFVELKGEGDIFASSAKLDLTIPQNIILSQEAVNARIKNQVQNTIKVVQKEYGADIFGFGSTIYQRNPAEWKKLSEKWDKVFSEAEVLVSVDFKARTSGMSGPPMYLKENEEKTK